MPQKAEGTEPGRARLPAARRYDESTGRKRALEEELADLEGKLVRAEKLVTGLAGERIRWCVCGCGWGVKLQPPGGGAHPLVCARVWVCAGVGVGGG